MSSFDAIRPDATDEACIVGYAREGSQRTIETLVERHWAGAYRLALRALGDPAAAEDAAQDAFVATMRAARRFDANRAFLPWFRTILTNAIRRAGRSRTRRRRYEAAAREASPMHASDASTNASTNASTVVRALADAELSATVHAKLEALPHALRSVLELHYLEQLTHQEIAVALGCPRGTVASRIRRGLEELRRAAHASGLAVTLTALEALVRTDAALARAPLPAPDAPPFARLEARRAHAARLALAQGAGTLAAGVLALAIVAWGAARLDLLDPRAEPRLRGEPEVASAMHSRPQGASGATRAAPRPEEGGRVGGAARDSAGSASALGEAERASAPALDAAARTSAEAADAVLWGQVLAAETGRPVAGAELTLTLKTSNRGRFERATTDAHGRFVFPPASDLARRPDGRIAPAADGDPYALVALVTHADGRALDVRRIDSVDPDHAALVLLEPGGVEFEARVLDHRTLESVEGVLLRVQLESGDLAWLGPPVRSGVDGWVRLSGLAPGWRLGLTVDSDDGALDATHFGLVVTAELSPPDVLLVSARTQLLFRVLEADGSAAPSFWVELGDGTRRRGLAGRDGELLLDWGLENLGWGPGRSVIEQEILAARTEADLRARRNVIEVRFPLVRGEENVVRLALPAAAPRAPSSSAPAAGSRPSEPRPRAESPAPTEAVYAVDVVPPAGSTAESIRDAVHGRLYGAGAAGFAESGVVAEPTRIVLGDTRLRLQVTLDRALADAPIAAMVIRLVGCEPLVVEPLRAGGRAVLAELRPQASPKLLSGRIRLPTGAPATGAEPALVLVTSDEIPWGEIGGIPWGASNRGINADGSFTYTDVPSCDVRLTVDQPGYVRLVRVVDMRGDQDLGDLVLEAAQPAEPAPYDPIATELHGPDRERLAALAIGWWRAAVEGRAEEALDRTAASFAVGQKRSRTGKPTLEVLDPGGARELLARVANPEKARRSVSLVSVSAVDGPWASAQGLAEVLGHGGTRVAIGIGRIDNVLEIYLTPLGEVAAVVEIDG